MTEELVVIPLRVTKEQRRKWRVIAGAEDKSVQQWILGQLNPVCIVPSVAPKTVQVASEKPKVLEVPKTVVKAPVAKPGYEYGKKCRQCEEPLKNEDPHFLCPKCRDL